MTDIEVTRATAFTAAADLDALADTLPRVQGFLNQYVYSDMEGGFFLTDAGDSINELRYALYSQYAFGAGTVYALLKDGGDAVIAAYREVEKADQEAGDVILPPWATDVLGNGTGGAFGVQGVTVDPRVAQEPVQPVGDGPAVSSGDYDSVLAEPEPDLSAIKLMDDVMEVRDKVGAITGLEWALRPLKGFGLTNPIEDFKNYMDGEYVELATALAAVGSLGDYWLKVHGDLVATELRLRQRWAGRGGEAAADWVRDLSGAVLEHQTAIRLVEGKIANELVLLKESLDVLLNLVQEIMECIPDADNKLEALLELPWAAAKVLTKLTFGVEKFLIAFDSLMVICLAVISLLSQSTKDLEFPYVRSPSTIPSGV